MENNNNETYYSIRDAIMGVKLFSRYLFKRWWLILIVIFLGALIGIGLYRTQKPNYEAESTFILEEKSAGGGGLASLASQFGVDLGSLSGGGNIFAGDNILSILTSKKVVYKVLLTSASDTFGKGETLADRYLAFMDSKKSWKKNPSLAELQFFNVKQLTPLHDSVLNVVYENVVRNNIVPERTSKQGTIIRVQVNAPDQLFARLMTERLVAEAGKLYLDIRVGTAQENIQQMQRRSDSLLALLNNRSYRAAASQPLDVNPGIRTAIVPVEIATRDKTVLATLYAEVTKNLEASKLLLSQQTPVIQLLDQPGQLLKDNKKGLLFLIAASTIGLLFAYIIISLLVYSWTKK